VWESDYEYLMQWKWHAEWSEDVHGFYASRREYEPGTGGRIVRMHRHLLGLNPGDSQRGDHWNGNTLDFRRTNLRRVSCRQNQQNQKKGKRNTSGYKGVSRAKEPNKWRATIMVDGKQKWLGQYDAPEKAARKYDEAAVTYYGDSARLNFPQEWGREW
jgi:hypothetical protein